MRDTLAARVLELSQARQPFVQATVVRAQHPTSVHAGDSALLFADGRIEGFVGGACAEASVRTYGLEALRTGEPLLLRVLAGTPGATVEEGAVTVTNPCASGGSLEIFLEPRRPPARIVVVGDTPVAAALATLAEPLGFTAEMVAGESAGPRPDDAAVIVASHGRGEEPALTAALRAGVPYVALVASRTRGVGVLASLDVDDAARARVQCPAGLDIGARTAAEIALSILAELVEQRARGTRRVSLVAPTTAVDPVCGMSVAVTGGAPSVECGGETAYFCSDHCRVAFLDDPGRYVTDSATD